MQCLVLLHQIALYTINICTVSSSRKNGGSGEKKIVVVKGEDRVGKLLLEYSRVFVQCLIADAFVF